MSRGATIDGTPEATCLGLGCCQIILSEKTSRSMTIAAVSNAGTDRLCRGTGSVAFQPISSFFSNEKKGFDDELSKQLWCEGLEDRKAELMLPVR